MIFRLSVVINKIKMRQTKIVINQSLPDDNTPPPTIIINVNKSKYHIRVHSLTLLNKNNRSLIKLLFFNQREINTKRKAGSTDLSFTGTISLMSNQLETGR